MAKRLDILDVYRDFRKKDPGYIHAFGDAEYFTFYMSDAHRINEALPDVPIERGNRCEQIRVHKLAFFPLAARLKAQGVKVAMVARTLLPSGVYAYEVSGRSDD